MAIYSGTFTVFEKLAASKLNSMVTDINAHVHDARYYTESEVDTKVAAAVPTGTVVLWYGTVATIPVNWELCDGTTYGAYTTPDLRDVFVVGAKQDDGGVAKTNLTGALTQSGGSKDHTHSMSFSTSGYSGTQDQRANGVQVANVSHSHTVSGTTANLSTIAVPYYSLCYIMKVA